MMTLNCPIENLNLKANINNNKLLKLQRLFVKLDKSNESLTFNFTKNYLFINQKNSVLRKVDIEFICNEQI